MNVKEGNAALLKVPVGDLPILHRETTLFFRRVGFVTVGDVIAFASTDFAGQLQLHYAAKTIQLVGPHNTAACLATEQMRVIAAWLAANNLCFAVPKTNPA